MLYNKHNVSNLISSHNLVWTVDLTLVFKFLQLTVGGWGLIDKGRQRPIPSKRCVTTQGKKLTALACKFRII